METIKKNLWRIKITMDQENWVYIVAKDVQEIKNYFKEENPRFIEFVVGWYIA